MAWDGVERRRDDNRHQENLVRLDRLADGIWEMSGKIGIIETRLEGLKENDNLVRSDLAAHTVQDRWVQGLILAALLGLMVKAFLLNGGA